MSSTPSAARRHQRQRSSVSVKKRTSLTNMDQDVQDNALSSNLRDRPDDVLGSATSSLAHSRHVSLQARKVNILSSPSEAQEDSNASDTLAPASPSAPYDQPPSQDYFSLGSPYPDKQAGEGTMGSLYADADTVERASSPSPTLDLDNASRTLMGDTTTRTEIDLFDDEDDNANNCITSPVVVAPPAVPPKEIGANQDPSALPKRSDSLQSDSLSSGHSQGQTKATESEAPSSKHSSLGSNAPTPTSARSGAKSLNLLSGSGLGSGYTNSPNVSPTTSRVFTAGSGFGSTSTPGRKLQKSKRMSLGYVPSPTASKSSAAFTGSMSHDSPTPSAIETPPLASSSAGSSYFARLNGNIPKSPPSDLSMVDTSTVSSRSPTLVRSLKREDGETVMTQHKDLLSRIAEKERRIFELREGLTREESELKALQVDWQKSVHREMAGEPSGPAHGSSSTAALSSTPLAQSQSIGGVGGENRGFLSSAAPETRSREARQAPSTYTATEGWKAFSARISGAGSQLNALIDQLATPSEEEKKDESVRMASAVAGLDVLQEEAEEGDTGHKAENMEPPPLPSKAPSAAPSSASSRQTKRTSMFGTSMAALQKQMELQFAGSAASTDKGAAANDTAGTEESSEAGGWGGWQKRLKEARENASGLLAKAEARLGQALTIDDFLEESQSPGKTSTPVPNTLGFSEENDREKAALAELSWLNSLAGINMTGTTDRVVTSSTSARRSPELQSKKLLNSQNLLELDRTGSNSSRTSRRASNTSHSTATTNATTAKTAGANWLASPPLKAVTPSLEDEARSPSSGRNSAGFFSLLSNAWGSEKVGMQSEERKSSSSSNGNGSANSATSRHRRQASSGQSKTRVAVTMAMQDKQDSNRRPSADRRSTSAPGQDNSSTRADAEADDDGWGW